MNNTDISTAGYANVNGLRMYYEIHGNGGTPLVLLHGGVLTIDMTFGAMVADLSANRQVIAIELQAHGHTADIDRPITLDNLAGDVVALLDQLGIEQVDMFGYSLGGLTALRVAMLHPDRVRRLVAAATHYRSSGYHPGIRPPQPELSADRMPTMEEFQQWQESYERVAPHPDQFFALAEKATPAPDDVDGWLESELQGITARTLLVIADNDFVRLDHAAAMRDLIPGAQLAVIPGATHTGLLRRIDLLLPLVESHLSEKS
ncbi:alpha/beta fold hydrolase [Pseudonocardia sp. TRM90224]|uniref:alpha/beta fold hydrolase n=1 Tax=Pseudonocardia sp. TRM90224 TaxID=2812678 RepID=UPI001E52A030|nr:alpha/beta hydrolase [Pseudonocardia sp. TRM90224]